MVGHHVPCEASDDVMPLSCKLFTVFPPRVTLLGLLLWLLRLLSSACRPSYVPPSPPTPRYPPPLADPPPESHSLTKCRGHNSIYIYTWWMCYTWFYALDWCVLKHMMGVMTLLVLCVCLVDVQDAEVANMYLSDHNQFLSTARFWTECYAIPKDGDSEVCWSCLPLTAPWLVKSPVLSVPLIDACGVLFVGLCCPEFNGHGVWRCSRQSRIGQAWRWWKRSRQWVAVICVAPSY